ncbi:MAG: hypothetical protein PHS79_03440 [Patescibacteria group bacterium]|nr:hypothetical protein [Patescibacteria group bacterium]
MGIKMRISKLNGKTAKLRILDVIGKILLWSMAYLALPFLALCGLTTALDPELMWFGHPNYSKVDALIVTSMGFIFFVICTLGIASIYTKKAWWYYSIFMLSTAVLLLLLSYHTVF